jgi:LAS superfamily LD-carboxypeptidase LdcB
MAEFLPVTAVSIPAALCGKENGKLPDSILESTPGQAGGPKVILVKPAARAWRAMCAAAKTAGFTFVAVSAADSYRTLERQENAFRDRYSETEIAGRPKQCWKSKLYWQKPNKARTAVPGTSNHGLGLAVDIAEMLNADTTPDPIREVAVKWLSQNAAKFGFSAELQEEPWHWRYWAGDDPPAAVLDFERAGQPERTAVGGY